MGSLLVVWVCTYEDIYKDQKKTWQWGEMYRTCRTVLKRKSKKEQSRVPW
jgi:hypothetical protein